MPEFRDFSTLNDLYRYGIERFAARPLFGSKINQEWQWMSYAEFGQEVERARRALTKAGITKGDRVALIASNRVEWAQIAYASFSIGAVIVPMYETQQDKEWEFILANSGAKILFVSTAQVLRRVLAFRARLSGLRQIIHWDNGTFEVPSFGEWISAGESVSLGQPAVMPEDMAALIYTSGTTGSPKGVVLSHGNLASNVSAFQGLFDITETDRSLSFLPWAHAFGQTAELHMLFSSGAAMGLVESIDKIVSNLVEVEPTLLISVPRIFNRIYDGLHKALDDGPTLRRRLFYAAMRNAERRRFFASQGRFAPLTDLKHAALDALVLSKVRARFGGKLRFAVSGSAALSTEVATFIDNLGIAVYEGYGLSEASPVVSVNTPQHKRVGSVGKPLRNVEVRIHETHEDNELQQEVWVRGPNVMQGYFNLPDETRHMLDDQGYLHTGDMGYLDDDGYLFLTGRISEKYKLENGKFVVPSLLEEQLKLSPYILNSFIWGENKAYNVALIVIDVDRINDWAKQQKISIGNPKDLLVHVEVEKLIEGEIKQRLSTAKSYEKIKRFALIDEDFTIANGMLTPSLKVKRRMVMQRHGEKVRALYP